MTTRMRAADRRAQLLELCARIVDTEGFHAATLDRVAADAGVTRTVLYQHFGGLDGLHDAVVTRATERATATLVAAGGRAASTPVDVLRAVLDAADADPATWRLFLVVAPTGPPALVNALAAGRRALRERVTAQIATTDDSDDPELSARLIQAVADEIVRLRLADPSTYDYERLLARFEETLGALTGHQPTRRSRTLS